jgi:hypothetical protein
MKRLTNEIVVALVLATERNGLAEVPRIVATLIRMGWSRDEAQAALLAAARAEQIELRPEGGLSRFAAHELALCPTMSDGTRLSYCCPLV